MNVRVPKRFSLRTLLLVTAIVALSIVAVRDYVSLRDARERYNYMRASWMTNRITAEALVDSSEELTRAEADSLWISRRAADVSHIDRMQKLIDYYDSGLSELRPETEERCRKYVHDSIRRHER